MSPLNYESILETAPCGFISFKPDGTIVHINRTLLTWLNYTDIEQVLEMKFNDLIGKGGRLYFQMFVFPLLNMQGYVNEISIDLVPSQGANITCLFNGSIVKLDEGASYVIHAILFNITDRKKYEVELFKAKLQAEEEQKRFRFLANTLPSILWTAHPSGKISFLNARFTEYFGTTVKEPDCWFLKKVLFTEDFYMVSQSWATAMKELKELQWELRIKDTMQEYKWFFVRIIPCKDSQGNLSMWLGSCTDIHIQKTKQLRVLSVLNNELSTASTNSRNQSKILREVAYTQSHLVRSPLSKILGLVSLLNLQEVDEESRLLISLITDSAMELDTIVTNIVTKSNADPASIF